MIINHNINAMRICRYMNINMALASKAMQRISSGYRINSAADDPAGLGISEGMRAQIRGLQQASRNAQDGISAIQVADGALNETQSMLQRLRELAVQAANGTYTSADRKSIQCEIDQLTEGINRIAADTEFNTKKLLDSNGVNSVIKLQIGANSEQVMGIQLQDMRSDALNICGIDVSTPEKASAAIKTYDDAINKVSSFRATLGATENVLGYRIDYLDNTSENLTAAESRIRDADMAKEIMEYEKHNILCQVCQSLLAQANHQNDSIIELLKSL